ncbi:MAG: phosphatidylserine decarboxylase [Myxococcales bacterium]|nr:phosphatidylserine decarboxylase [Myxococcales bacterium]MCB9641887.1 phosphatidylserine decarboxylase [Myxococcales bacterium]
MRPFLRWYAGRYGVNLDEAEHPIEHYTTFTGFFTRRLKPGLRPLDPDPNVIVSPVDGAIAMHGTLEEGRAIQAKGISYTVEDFLDDAQAAERFKGGSFLTIYLSPKDYHRIHSPIQAKIDAYRYIPGRLLPVNPPSVAHFARLFVENERLTSYMHDPKVGHVALVKVGATNVGRMHLYYHDFTSNRWGSARSHTHTFETPVEIGRGDELAVFELGSTVVLLFEPHVKLRPLTVGSSIQLGQAIAEISTEA